ncbi:MAG: hypothetical protein PHO62_07545 [Sulfurimonas sp.]|uniref:hypothetical protein n=1 Tax=Sulfurimonas sp. TaxID=2022749 RepID=UPI002603F093|nr:hypothetical protein [Sulfurimonas sp.]MDD5373259.1 hypothetical protein [Sulfurimonas sp.]
MTKEIGNPIVGVALVTVIILLVVAFDAKYFILARGIDQTSLEVLPLMFCLVPAISALFFIEDSPSEKENSIAGRIGLEKHYIFYISCIYIFLSLIFNFWQELGIAFSIFMLLLSFFAVILFCYTVIFLMLCLFEKLFNHFYWILTGEEKKSFLMSKFIVFVKSSVALIEPKLPFFQIGLIIGFMNLLFVIATVS